MWLYIGTAIAGVFVLVLQQFYRRRSASAPLISSKQVPPISATRHAETPTATKIPPVLPLNFGSPSRQPSSSALRGSFVNRDGQNGSPAAVPLPTASPLSGSTLKRGPSEAMLKKSGSFIRPSGLSPSSSPDTTSSGSRLFLRKSASPKRESVSAQAEEEVVRSASPIRESKHIESPVSSPVSTPPVPSGALETASTEPEATPEDKLCDLEPRFEIDYWQLLPNLGDMVGEGGYAEV